MASTISTGALLASAGNWAAISWWRTASAVYVLVQNSSTGKLRVYKSTDGASWTEQDAANAVTNNTATSPFCTPHPDSIVGTVVPVFYFTAANTVRARGFDTSDDTWDASDIGGVDITTNGHQSNNLVAAMRSDGDIFLAHSNSSGTNMGSRIWEGSSWTSVSLSGGTTTPNACCAVREPDDRMRIPFNDRQGNDSSYNTLDTSNVAGGVNDFDNAQHTTAPLRSVLALAFNDGSADRFAHLKIDTGGEGDVHLGTTGAAALSSTSVVNAVTDSTTLQPTSGGILKVDTTLVVVWGEANTIKYDTSDDLTTPAFGTDSTLIGSLTDTDVCPVPIQAGGGWGSLYQDNGDVKVHWIVSPSFSTDATGTISAGALSVSGQTLTATAGTLATISTGSHTVSGQTVSGTVAETATIATGTHTVAGQTVTGEAGSVGTISTGSLAVAGQTVTGTEGGTPDTGTVTTGTLTVAGQTVTGLAGTDGTVNTGSHSVSGQTVAATAGSVGVIDVGAHVVAGQTVTGISGSVGVIGTGSLAVTGQTIVGDDTGAAPETGTISSGTLAVSGQTVTADTGSVGVVTTGTLTVSGQTVLGAATDTGSISTGTLSVSGQTIAADVSELVTFIAGTLAVSGQTITGLSDTLALIATGILTVEGQLVSGNDSSIPTIRPYPGTWTDIEHLGAGSWATVATVGAGDWSEP